MNKVDELAKKFQVTFEDKVMSKAEKKALRMVIEEADLDSRELDVLRSKVFDIAREAMKTTATMFALDWAEDASRLLLPKPKKEIIEDSSVYFSPGETCLNAIISQIKNARSSLDVCVFTISDDRITAALMERHRRGLPIRIISDNDKVNDPGSDVARLADAGLNVRIDRTPYHMHHKYAVADGAIAITGSYNWTRSAARNNEENLLVTREPIVVRRYRDAFLELWAKTDPF